MSERSDWDRVADAFGAVRLARSMYGSTAEGAERVRDVVEMLRKTAENGSANNERFVRGVAQAIEDGFL